MKLKLEIARWLSYNRIDDWLSIVVRQRNFQNNFLDFLMFLFILSIFLLFGFSFSRLFLDYYNICAVEFTRRSSGGGVPAVEFARLRLRGGRKRKPWLFVSVTDLRLKKTFILHHPSKCNRVVGQLSLCLGVFFHLYFILHHLSINAIGLSASCHFARVCFFIYILFYIIQDLRLKKLLSFIKHNHFNHHIPWDNWQTTDGQLTDNRQTTIS